MMSRTSKSEPSEPSEVLPTNPEGVPGRGDRIAVWLDLHVRHVFLAFVVVTVALVGANVLLATDIEASQEPSAAVFEARDTINERLEPVAHTLPVIVEAPAGDILLPTPLAELAANAAALREADGEGLLAPETIGARSLLLNRYDREAGATVNGFLTLAEVVEQVVADQFGVDLAAATRDQVKVVVHQVLSEPGTEGLRGQLSEQATATPATVLGSEITLYESPALVFTVAGSNAALGGGQFAIGPSADPVVHQKEAFNLNIESALRGDQNSISVLGVAAAANETSESQGRAAAPFIILSVVAAVAVVAFVLRSYWATALTGLGLVALMSWLGGISNLLGLKGGLVIELLVPISMVALGVDFAVHSMAHYQHERRANGAARGFILGFGGVASAIGLAAVTDSAAFLSNASSDIESIVDFSIAAAVGTFSSFIVLGVVAPLALSRIEAVVGTQAKIGRFKASRRIATVRVAVFSGVAAVVTIAVSPLAGGALLIGGTMVNVVAPLRYARKNTTGHELTTADADDRLGHWVESVVAFLSDRPIPVLLATSAFTALAVFGAIGLQGSFTISDFFASDTDFVQSVEQLPVHVGQRQGEANQIVIEGDLEDPAVWADIATFVDALDDNTALAFDADGLALATPDPLELLSQAVFDSDSITAATGVPITDIDANAIPDTSEQIQAVFSYAAVEGLSAAGSGPSYTAAEVRATVDLDLSGVDAAVIGVQVPNPSDLDVIRTARTQLLSDTGALEASSGIASVKITGSGLGRLEVIDASTDALKTALPIAIVAVFLVLLVALRSLRYALITVVPMVLVAAWLYGTMAALGFDLNFVTATIGAISIGVSADYAIHMTERYRREWDRLGSHRAAARSAGRSTGAALLGSAFSTALGFAVLALAPMPLFATFGVLTALMVIYALLASVVVLPALLGLFGPALATANAPAAVRPHFLSPLSEPSLEVLHHNLNLAGLLRNPSP